MVYYGPSRGCSNCRTRRVRCDLQQPACARCVKRKEQCSGPRSDDDIKAERAANSDRIVKRDMHYAESILTFDAHDSLRDDPVELARSFYETTYAQASIETIFHGGVLISSNTSPPELLLATDALALELFCYWHRISTESRAIQNIVGQTLSTLRTLVSDPTSVKKDAVLATALMLQVREKIGTLNSSQPTYHHLEGALALVRNRGIDDFQTQQSRNLLAAVRHNCLLRALRGDGDIDPEEDLWRDVHGKTPHDSNNIDGILDPFAYDVVNLQRTVTELEAEYEIGSGSAVLPTPASLLSQALDIESALFEWEEQQPSHTKPFVIDNPGHIPTSLYHAGIFEGRCETFYTIETAQVHITYLYLHTCVYECIARLEALQPEHEVDLVELTAAYNRASTIIDELCFIVPYFLGNRKGVNYISAFTEVHKHQYPSLDAKSTAKLAELAEENGATTNPLPKKQHAKRVLSMGGFPLYSPMGMALSVLRQETYAAIQGTHAQAQQQYLQSQLARMMRKGSYFCNSTDPLGDHNLILKHAGVRAFDMCAEVHASAYEAT